MSSSHEADAGRTSVRTTIVGGQPPGNARPLGEVPIGMERLLGLAAVDDCIAAELERDPEALAQGCGVALEPTELSVLAATPLGALRSMLDGIRTGLAEPARRELIKRAAMLATALFATGAAGGGCKGTTPDPSPTPGSEPRPGATDMGSPPSGMDTPPENMAPPPKVMTAEPDAGVPPRKPPPYVDQVKRGVSPRRPRPKQPGGTRTGIRPK